MKTEYDYRYLIIHQMVQILDDINVGQGLCSCRLSYIGRIVQDEIQNVTNRYVGAEIDKYVIVLNYIHIIILLGRQEHNGKSRALALQLVRIWSYANNNYRYLIIHQMVQILDDINVGQGLCSCRLSYIGGIVQDEIQNITNC